MILDNLKIFQTGDIQIEVRNQQQRYDEFVFLFGEIEKQILQNKPDVYLLSGDIYENWNANDIERGIFIDHLNRVLQYDFLQEVVIQDGNHDINQRKDSNFFKQDGKDALVQNALSTLWMSINNPKLMYLDESKFYKSKNIEGLCYINWSQKTKHSNLRDQEYNPLYNVPENYQVRYFSDYTCITLYHDPIREAINFDGKSLKGSDTQPSLSESFATRTIYAGDIHMPQIHEFKLSNNEDATFIYCSSPIQRNFGEGDYYMDGLLYQKGVENHKTNLTVLKPDGTLLNQQYLDVLQHNSYNTFKISTKVEKPEDINWEIINKGVKKSTVRISYPSASEKFISWENKIIELIKLANPNTNLVFTQSVYGKGVNEKDIETNETLSDVNELLQIDKVIEISKTYISDIVNKTSTISVDDKEKCIKYIEELFISELKNFDNDIKSNKISLVECLASNFMSFGDNVKVDLSLIGLTKLTGGNGVGKTTLYNFLNWIITGLISVNQNKNHKSANNLLVFNDYRWDVDTVNGSLIFYNNGIPTQIERCLERSWKRNTTDEQKKSKQWRNYISGVTETLTLTDLSSQTATTGDSVQTVLDSIFRGISNLKRLVFVNDASLEQMIKTDTSTLCEEILYNIGFNFFDLMLQRYDDLKSEKLESLSKPSISIDVLQQNLIESEDIKRNIESEYITIKNELLDVKEKIQNKELEKNTLLSKKHQITAEDIVCLKNELEADENNYDSIEKTINENIKSIEETKSLYRNENDLITESESKKKQKKLLEDDYNSSLITQNVNETNITNKKSELVKLYTDIENELMADINDKRLTIENRKISINGLKSSTSEINSKFELFVANEKQKVSDLLNQQNLKLNGLNSEKVQLDLKIQQLTKDITKLEESTDVCDKCGAPLSDDLLNQKKIDIENLSTDKINTIALSSAKDTEISNQDKIVKNIQKLLNELNIKDYINHKIISDEWNRVRTEELSKNELAIDKFNTEIEKLQNEIDTQTPIIKESVKKDKRILDLGNIIQEMINSNNQLDILNKEKKNNIETIDSEILSIGLDIDKVQVFDKQILSLQNDLKIHQTKKELFGTRRNDISKKEKQLEENNQLDINILEIQTIINTYITERDTIDEKIKSMDLNKATIDEKILSYKTDINNAIQYRIIDASFKQYKTLLGKKGLSLYIFSLIRPILNSKLNDLLEDMDFRLQFIEDNSLQMMDLSKPGTPIRSPFTISGMQTVFCGLSLLYINRNCNVSFKMSELFIDEVSGKLNNGKDLEYKSMNYQNQLKKLLRKFTDMKIFIVDHVIENMEEDTKLQVIPTNDGAQIIKVEI